MDQLDLYGREADLRSGQYQIHKVLVLAESSALRLELPGGYHLPKTQQYTSQPKLEGENLGQAKGRSEVKGEIYWEGSLM